MSAIDRPWLVAAPIPQRDTTMVHARSPAKFVHIVYRTRRFEQMLAWYHAVFDARIQHPAMAFLTDDEHHRFAFINLDVLMPAADGAPPTSKRGQRLPIQPELRRQPHRRGIRSRRLAGRGARWREAGGLPAARTSRCRPFGVGDPSKHDRLTCARERLASCPQSIGEQRRKLSPPKRRTV
ncbi:hypothetical protein THIX_30009 [Thiomonas sp. X19]|nr:hypothetical protein THIX_30009 [Thiomonas sp. X19]